MYKQQIIDLVLTEDSDLLAYGVKKVLFKMTQDGNGIEINLDKLKECPEYVIAGGNQLTQEMFLHACIISGCDYHSGIPGIGYKTALQILKHHKPVGDIAALC